MLWFVVLAVVGGLLFVIFHKPSLNVGGLSTHRPTQPKPTDRTDDRADPRP